MQTTIDNNNVINATAAVVKAEGSKLQADVNSAQILVTALPTSTDKTNLQNRLNAVQSIINATNAVANAETNKTQANVDSARTLVSALPLGTDKTNLSTRLDTVQTAIDYNNKVVDATAAVVKVEGSKIHADMYLARTLVTAIPPGTDKTNLTNRNVPVK